MSSSGPPTDDELVVRFAAGTLIHDIRLDPDSDRPDSLLNRVIALHNAGRLDLLSLTTGPAFDRLTGTNFFSLQQVFCDAIPELGAPLATMTMAIKRLVEKGGSDGAATFPFRAFLAWLRKDLSRADAIIDAFRSGSSDDRQFLALALEAKADPALIAPFLGFDDERRQAAASALGTIKPADDTAAADALAKLLPIAQADTHDMTRFTAIFSMFAILQNAAHLSSVWVPQIIRAIIDSPTDNTRIALLQGLSRQISLFDAATVKSALAVTTGGDLSHSGLLNMLGIVIGQLLPTPHRDIALDCLTDLLSPEDSALTLDKWQFLQHALQGEDRGKKFSLAVRWFATGNPRLCSAVANIVVVGGKAEPFDNDLTQFDLSGRAQVALCQKAISYLFIHPAAAASFLVAALRAGDKEVRDKLIELVIYPILINYSEGARPYLRKIAKGDPAYGSVRKALKRGDNYIKHAEIKTPIKELWPTEYQRNIARQRRHDFNIEIQKQAESQSVFAGLFHKSIILHGRKTTTYFEGLAKPPITMDMHPISHSLELPRLDILDPVGLDMLLRLFAIKKAP